MSARNPNVAAILSGRGKPFSGENVNAPSSGLVLDVESVVSIGQLNPKNISTLGAGHSSSGRKCPQYFLPCCFHGSPQCHAQFLQVFLKRAGFEELRRASCVRRAFATFVKLLSR